VQDSANHQSGYKIMPFFFLNERKGQKEAQKSHNEEIIEEESSDQEI
jgi:hypothetical protein